MAEELAISIDKYFSSVKLIVLTDKPHYFKNRSNILAFKHRQKGIWNCYNDRRFAIEKGLLLFNTVIHIDADTRIVAPPSSEVSFSPGISGCTEDIIEHVGKYRPERLKWLIKLSSKIGIEPENAKWIGESLYAVSIDNGKEKEFIKQWGLIASYLELHGVHIDGPAIGLAASKVGWQVKSDEWKSLKEIVSHADASYEPQRLSFFQTQFKRIKYHYRFNKARLMALKEYEFYYK